MPEVLREEKKQEIFATTCHSSVAEAVSVLDER
jgi:hypothetical protein